MKNIWTNCRKALEHFENEKKFLQIMSRSVYIFVLLPIFILSTPSMHQINKLSNTNQGMNFSEYVITNDYNSIYN